MTPSIHELAAIVGEMQDRDAIWQCLLRYARGVDRFDSELIRSAFHPDAIDDHGKFLGGPDEFVEWAKHQHTEAHLGHQHNLFNHTCDLSGDVAHAETYFMFAGMNRKGSPLVLNGGRYLDRLEKRDGEWRIAFRTLVRDWGLMDETPNPDEQSSYTSTRSYLSDEIRDFMNECPPGRRNASDPSYGRPLEVSPERVESWKRLNNLINGQVDTGTVE
ncbi:MAG: SnoaL-like protein [Pseudarthrobacter sp.]|nr:SnoaL-like protein [Pseudarthrobacter sp.]